MMIKWVSLDRKKKRIRRQKSGNWLSHFRKKRKRC